MNFVVTRSEIVVLAKLSRTETFALQKSGKLKVLGGAGCKGLFELTQVLTCLAAHRNLPPPDDASIAFHANLAVQMRLKKAANATQKSVRL